MTIKKPTDKYASLNGLLFHYVDWGSGLRPTMLLLHGFMGHARVWDVFAKQFRNRYHVIALDQRGHGKSEWSKKGDYTLDDHFSDITRFIEKLNLAPLVLVGHSMGGRNAIFYTACFPQNVRCLVLVDARPGNTPNASLALKRLIAKLPVEADTFETAAEAVRSVFPYISKEFCRNMAKYGFRKSSDGKLTPCYDTKMSLSMERSGFEIEDLWCFLRHLTCPTLVIRGKESEFLSLSDVRKMCEIIPDATWREIPDATHMPAQENPANFIQVVDDFLKKIER